MFAAFFFSAKGLQGETMDFLGTVLSLYFDGSLDALISFLTDWIVVLSL